MKFRAFVFFLAAAAVLPSVVARARQVADPDFDTKDARPAYDGGGPRALFDEAHNDSHTAAGRYKPFADLITADGYRVTPNRQKLTRDVLEGFDILAIANARAAGSPPAVWAPDLSGPNDRRTTDSFQLTAKS